MEQQDRQVGQDDVRLDRSGASRRGREALALKFVTPVW